MADGRTPAAGPPSGRPGGRVDPTAPGPDPVPGPDALVTSPSNPRVKAVVRLRKRRERDRSGLMVVEGYRELRRALAAGVVVRDLYVSPELWLGVNEAALVEGARRRGARVVVCSAAAFGRMSYRDRPEGLLAVAETPDVGTGRLRSAVEGARAAGRAPLVLVCERIEKPGNLGTMVRTAAAAGADAVVVADPTCDPWNPNVVRASLGAVFGVPLTVTSGPEARRALGGLTLVAATPEPPAVPHWEAPLAGAVAVVVGSEQYGLDAAWLEAADVRARIPMPGASGDVADSLNAATAAAVVLFEAVRQRHRPERPPGADAGGRPASGAR